MNENNTPLGPSMPPEPPLPPEPSLPPEPPMPQYSQQYQQFYYPPPPVPVYLHDQRETSRAYNLVGGALLAVEIIKFSLLMSISGLIGLFIAFEVFDESIATNTYLNLGLTFLLIYLIYFPLIWIMIKRLPSVPPDRKKMSVGVMFLFFLMTQPLMYAGALIGGCFSLVFRQSSNIEGLLDGSGVWLAFVFILILAPIFEEVIFRKLLIDKLRRFGRWPAIIVSSVAFGLFHGNLQQLFFATFVGVLLGIVYEKYGKLRHVIFLHFLVNLFGSVPAFIIMRFVPESYRATANMIHLLGIVATLCLFGLILLIYYIVDKRFVLPEPVALSEDGQIIAKCKPAWGTVLSTPALIIYGLVTMAIMGGMTILSMLG